MEKKTKFTETGEIRSPKEGEWFKGFKNYPVRARFDFEATEFPILKREVIEYKCHTTTTSRGEK